MEGLRCISDFCITVFSVTNNSGTGFISSFGDNQSFCLDSYRILFFLTLWCYIGVYLFTSFAPNKCVSSDGNITCATDIVRNVFICLFNGCLICYWYGMIYGTCLDQ